MREIEINDLQSHLSGLTERVADTLHSVLRLEAVEAYDLSVAIVNDERIRDLNRQFAGHDRPTDVLSFPLSGDSADGLTGEIVVNAERACEVASQRGGDAVAELLLYAIHGCLHLLDYDDQTPAAARIMHAREDELLSGMGFPNVYAGGDDPA
jgi:probable rRNA maturation factor